MACRILRAPAVAQNIQRAIPDLSLGSSHSSWARSATHGALKMFQIRGYNNYKTHGEMAALKEPADGNVFTDEPEYPEILDMTKEGKQLRVRQAHYDEVKKLPTAHHKMFIMNVERGREEMIYIGDLHYNSLNLYQYATRTNIIREQPASDGGTKLIDPALVSLIEEAVLTNTLTTQSSEKAKLARETNLVRCILDTIRYHYELADTVVLEEPRIEAFWQHPSFKTNRDKTRFEGKETFAPWFQFLQHPQLMISSDIPLKPIMDAQSEEVPETNIPTYDYFPEELGMYPKKHRLVSTAGYWCNAFQYPLLTTSSLTKVMPSSLDPSINTDHLDPLERRLRLDANALMMNFATAVGTAFSCGFTVFHEVTYPFVTQHIASDGKTWHFSKYQLNTMAFGPDFATDKHNYAWSSEEMKLYEKIEDGKVHGLNTAVLLRIVEAVRAPRQAVENPRPYTDLRVETGFLERGERLFKQHASRKFNLQEALNFEIPLWVKIYKMHEDAPPSPHVRWQRPKQKAPHVTQFDKEIYDAEIREVKERYKKVAREKLFGLRPIGRNPRPIGVHPSGRN